MLRYLANYRNVNVESNFCFKSRMGLIFHFLEFALFRDTIAVGDHTEVTNPIFGSPGPSAAEREAFKVSASQ